MMGLTLSKQEASDRVSEIVVVPPRLGRNEPCHCGSGIKYKRCCWERVEALRRQLRGAALPEWIDGSRSKLHQFEKYVSNVFGLPDLLDRKSVVWGKSVDLGGRRIIKKKKKRT